MAKALKIDLEKQHQQIRKEIYNDLAQISYLNSPQRKQSGLTPAEIFAKCELLKKHIQVLVLKKEKLEFNLELLKKCKGNSYHPAILHEYPLFVTKIIHEN